MEAGYYISNNRKIILAPNLEKLDLNIDQSNNITVIKCNSNLKKMILRKAFCSNPLKEIDVELNKSLEYLGLLGVYLKSLILNENLEELYCYDSKVSSLKLNKKLKKLNYSYSNLKEIELNENLEELDASNTYLEKIVINKKLKLLKISNRNNKNIHFDNSVNNTEVKIEYSILS